MIPISAEMSNWFVFIFSRTSSIGFVSSSTISTSLKLAVSLADTASSRSGSLDKFDVVDPRSAFD